MKYPGLTTSLRNQLTDSEWQLIRETIITVDSLAWSQTEAACCLLEQAAHTAIEQGAYRCAARVLYYYDRFYAA